MSDLAPVLTQCHTCRSDMRDTINGWMKAGVNDIEISRRLSEGGRYISRISLGKHRRKHLVPVHLQAVSAAVEARKVQEKVLAPKRRDVALLVQDIVARRIETGELEPTVSEGLRAQEIIDRRAEKAADIELQLIMASVLGGGTIVPDGGYIDAEAVEV